MVIDSPIEFRELIFNKIENYNVKNNTIVRGIMINRYWKYTILNDGKDINTARIFYVNNVGLNFIGIVEIVN